MLASCEYFTVEEWRGHGFTGNAEEGFVSLLVLDCAAGAKLVCAGGTLGLRKGESILIPAGAGGYRINGRCRVLVTTV